MPKLVEEALSEEGLALAINLIDLERVDLTMRDGLFGSGLKLLYPQPIWAIRANREEAYLAFACSLLQAAAICDIIRDHDRKVGESPTRVCLRRSKAWERVPADAFLVVDEKLNPRLFPAQQAFVTKPIYPKARRI